MKTKKVRIVKASCLRSGNKGNHFKEVPPWYEDKIENIYDVAEESEDFAGNECYKVIKDGYSSGLYIKVEDCEDVI